MFSLINASIYSIILKVNYGFYSKYYNVLGVWVIFANIALAKSRQNTCILLFNDNFIKLRVQFIKSILTKVGTTLSLIEHFYKMAKQNLWVTVPFSWSFNIFIIFSITILLFPWQRYSTPLKVEEITDTSEQIACFKD